MQYVIHFAWRMCSHVHDQNHATWHDQRHDECLEKRMHFVMSAARIRPVQMTEKGHYISKPLRNLLVIKHVQKVNIILHCKQRRKESFTSNAERLPPGVSGIRRTKTDANPIRIITVLKRNVIEFAVESCFRNDVEAY